MFAKPGSASQKGQGANTYSFAAAFWYWVAFTSLSMTAGPPAAAQVGYGIKTASYGPKPLETLDLCLPRDRAKVRIAVVAIHGGGLFAGDKALLTRRMCRWFDPVGIMVASLNYRLADAEGHGIWPRPLADVQLAVRWLRAHASDYGVRLHRICAVGASSGGHLAVFLAALPHPVPSDVSDLLPGISPAVDCAVDQWGPVDYTHPSPVMKKTLSLLFPNERAGRAEQNAREASPLYYLHKGMGSILVLQGESDPAVPVLQSSSLIEALQKITPRSRMIVFSGKHGLPSSEWDKIGLSTIVPFVLDESNDEHN